MGENLRNICLYLFELNHGLTNLKLQKLLYFVQVYCLVEFDEIAFDDQIEAWPYGPVVPEAYFAMKRGEFIGTVANTELLDERIRTAIEEISDIFREWNAFDMVDLTHEYNIWENKVNSIFSNKIMLPEEIQQFHLERLRETGSVL